MSANSKCSARPETYLQHAGTWQLVRDCSVSAAFLLGCYALTYLTNVVFARLLTPEQFGDYAIGLTTLLLGSMVALLGSEEACARYIPAYLVNGDQQRVSGFLRFFITVSFLSSIGVAALVWLSKYIGLAEADPFDLEHALHPITIAATFIPLFALARVGSQILRGFGAVSASFFPHRILAPIVTLVLVVTLAMAGVTLNDQIVIGAVGVGFLVAAILQVGIFFWYRHHETLRHSPIFERNIWLRFSVPVMVNGVLFLLIHHGDLIMMEILGADEDMVGHFAAANSTVWTISVIYVSIDIILSPHIGAAVERKDTREIRRLAGLGTRLVVFGVGPIVAGLILFREPIMSLFGPSYKDATGALVILAIAYGTSAMFGLSRVLLQFLGRQAYVLWPMVGAVSLNFVLNAILIPPMGMVGSALGTLAALTLNCILLSVFLYRDSGARTLPFYIR